MLLIRHGQSHFNKHFSKSRIDPGIVDPRLTAEGRRQIETAAEGLLGEGHRVTRLISSPYWRALETAEIFAKALDLEIEVELLVAERAFFVCDIGSPRRELESRFRRARFGTLPEVWWPHPDESERELMARCRNFRLKAAKSADWPETLVVSHWGFIRGLTGRSVENAALLRHDPTVA